ncbi:MAG TPA: hypothetical protein VK841_08150 [Polyangiaceae bacterium]|jgi:hypothetical protein|nr:hypothetical protein [Polyangiaceae bacterium]
MTRNVGSTNTRTIAVLSCAPVIALAAALGAAAACGGTTGRPPPPEMSVPDASSGDPFDLDGGPFDVTIQYVDRVLPDVTPPPSEDAGADGGEGGAALNAWPCPPDLCLLSDDAGYAPMDPVSGCPDGSAPTAAAYEDGGLVIPAPFDSICASCAPYNDGAGCTPTEQLFVLHDPVPPEDGGMTCYQCMVSVAGALDDSQGDLDNECSDFTDMATFTAAMASAECFTTLACILGSPDTPNCVGSTVINGQLVGAASCYCGAGVDTGSCAAAGFQPTGVCAQQEAAGLGVPVASTVAAENMFTNVSLGSGQANEMFQKGIRANCTRCYE